MPKILHRGPTMKIQTFVCLIFWSGSVDCILYVHVVSCLSFNPAFRYVKLLLSNKNENVLSVLMWAYFPQASFAPCHAEFAFNGICISQGSKTRYCSYSGFPLYNDNHRYYAFLTCSGLYASYASMAATGYHISVVAPLLLPPCKFMRPPRCYYRL
jgi:hypothetical protein